MKDKSTTRLPGQFFMPYSELEDGISLACYYTPIYRTRNGQNEYPLSVVLGATHFSIYWHGYMPSEIEDWEYYGIHQLFNDDFTDQHDAPIENWLNHHRLVPQGLLDGKPYLVDRSPESKVGYRSYLFNKEIKSVTSEQDVFENFLLDLLFDLKHSGAFRGHPSREKLIGFLENISQIKAIWMKAEYHYVSQKLLEVKKRNTVAKKEDSQQLEYWEVAEKEATGQWLGYLRSQAGEQMVKDRQDDRWFSGVEAEHRAVYCSSNAQHLNKQAEDSIQWLIGRYALGYAYWLQIRRAYPRKNFVLLGLIFIVLCLSYFNAIEGLAFIHARLNWLPQWQGITGPYFWLFSILAIGSLIIFFGLVSLFIERFLSFILLAIALIVSKLFQIPNKHAQPEGIILAIPKIIALLKPKVLLASSAAWALLLSSSFVWNLDFQLSGPKWILLAVLVLFTFLFMATHLTGLIERKHKAWKVLGRAIFIFLLASFYSFIIGYVGMSITASDKLDNEYLKKYFISYHGNKPHQGFVSKSGTYMYIPDEKADSMQSLFHTKEASIDSSWVRGQGLNLLFHAADTSRRKVCYIQPLDIGTNEEDDALEVSHTIILVVETLVYFTFVAIALGIMLEMGLQIQRIGIGFD